MKKLDNSFFFDFIKNIIYDILKGGMFYDKNIC